ncbi:hypothetical protein JW851_05115 [Candidatus Woesearchaeota archaeon]|nr:hypothetical protein [Candidatus Woesearchaeota archaeon]
MVLTNLNKSKKRTLDAILSGDFQKAKTEIKTLIKKCYLLALLSKDEEIKRGLTYEGDLYLKIAKKLNEKPELKDIDYEKLAKLITQYLTTDKEPICKEAERICKEYFGDNN